jgi:hypothetical protein
VSRMLKTKIIDPLFAMMAESHLTTGKRMEIEIRVAPEVFVGLMTVINVQYEGGPDGPHDVLFFNAPQGGRVVVKKLAPQ